MPDYYHYHKPGYNFFLYDPNNEGTLFFRSEEERDEFAKKAVAEYCDSDGWSEDVFSICTGIVTHVATKTHIKTRPPEDELEEEVDGEGIYWGEFDEIYQVEVLPVDGEIT